MQRSLWRKEEIELPAKVNQKSKVLVLSPQLVFTIIMVVVLIFMGITALKMGVLAFQLTQANRRLEIEIKEMERTYQTLKEEFNHISSYFDVVYPTERKK
ncbi:hypothetical protein [Thermotoga sp.]|uniref:hypothetical protein n=1 Tax=Thermotoga sp. TaxID=28240 RepID=UPI0025D61B0E|nr:hypothetical protein [Thermotoga sp.]MCD6550974.1 hypothetical protein [Thermotoga sp.]